MHLSLWSDIIITSNANITVLRTHNFSLYSKIDGKLRLGIFQMEKISEANSPEVLLKLSGNVQNYTRSYILVELRVCYPGRHFALRDDLSIAATLIAIIPKNNEVSK